MTSEEFQGLRRGTVVRDAQGIEYRVGLTGSWGPTALIAFRDRPVYTIWVRPEDELVASLEKLRAERDHLNDRECEDEGRIG